jgi:adenosylcobinamide kinase/adenosylcobinamide-phosphate guanylyltransferase
MATCRVDPGDTDMAARVAVHRSTRSAEWTTVEEFLDLGRRLSEVSHTCDVVVVDCLTLWLSNLLARGESSSTIDTRIAELRSAVTAASAHVIVVSNEVGMGVVPETLLGRVFRDLQGSVNQAVAEIADDVFLVTAGLAQRLKSLEGVS